MRFILYFALAAIGLGIGGAMTIKWRTWIAIAFSGNIFSCIMTIATWLVSLYFGIGCTICIFLHLGGNIDLTTIGLLDLTLNLFK